MQHLFHFRFSHFQEIEAFSKVILTNLNASIKSGFLVFENGVFLFTNGKVLLISFKFIINDNYFS